MFENVINFFKKIGKKEETKPATNSKEAAKERLHLVLMQDRANVSADFLELMKQEIIEVIKKYIEVDESAIDVRLTNKENEDGTNGAPALYANIPILNIKNDARKIDKNDIEAKKLEQNEEKEKEEQSKEQSKIETENINKEIKDKKENKEDTEKEEKKKEKEINKNENKVEETKEIKQEEAKKENKTEIKQEGKIKAPEYRTKEKVKSEN